MKKYMWIIIILAIVILVVKKNKVMQIVWDTISESRINKLHPSIRSLARELVAKAQAEGIFLRVTSGMRTYEEQAKLYAKGRTEPGPIVTNAKPGYSYHNFGLALDVVPIENGAANWNSSHWNRIGQIGKSLGFDWGGDWKSFKDKPHFEKSFGWTLAQLRNEYELNGGQFIAFA
jgi:peptidoglycan LD-endopeptidase CwlK